MSYTVYLRTNKVNGKQYVGQTNDFIQRQYAWKCFKVRYANKIFDKDREKYGIDVFETTILAEVETQEEAWELEQKYINEYNTHYPNGYNLSIGGQVTKGIVLEQRPMYGKHHSEETIKKMSDVKKGHSVSEETRRKISEAIKGEKNPWYGKKLPEETRIKMSESRKKTIVQIDRITGDVIKE